MGDRPDVGKGYIRTCSPCETGKRGAIFLTAALIRVRQAFLSPCSSPSLSAEITLEDYRTRSIDVRVKESISRLFSPLG